MCNMQWEREPFSLAVDPDWIGPWFPWSDRVSETNQKEAGCVCVLGNKECDPPALHASWVRTLV